MLYFLFAQGEPENWELFVFKLFKFVIVIPDTVITRKQVLIRLKTSCYDNK